MLISILLVQRCEQQGWVLELPDAVRGQWQWFSATDAQRRDAIASAWRDPGVDGVIYVGGGWGAARVLEAGLTFPNRPLWALGFSDTSALLLAQWQAGLQGAVHGAMGTGSSMATHGGSAQRSTDVTA